MKKELYVIPNTLAVTSVIVYAVCRLLVGIFPDISFTIAQSWFHGIAINKQDAWDLTLSSSILGIVSLTITAWTAGFIFAYVYNYFAKRK